MTKVQHKKDLGLEVSFRDPAGHLFFYQEQVFRLINSFGKDSFESAINSKKLSEFIKNGSLVKVYDLEPNDVSSLKSVFERESESELEDGCSLVRHEKIPFLSYPFEWTPEMLYSAGVLTLDLAESIQSEQLGLKDATPLNVLFRGTKPVFVDWLSFEKRNECDPIWRSQAQFIRNFCLPLMVNKHFNYQLNWVFRVNRDGLDPEAVYQMLSPRRKLTPPFLSLVTIPNLLSKKGNNNQEIYQERTIENSEKAQFILSQQFKSLRRTLQKAKPTSKNQSNWSEYVGNKQHFTDAYFQQKKEFVEQSLVQFKPKTLLDVGCNTGFFSRLAAQSGASVVSVDQDAAVVGRVWEMADQENLDILPLVVDISRPSPALGWNNEEQTSFLDRAKGYFDSVLMLALIHHLLVSERVPLNKILSLAAQLTKDTAIIEFVPPDDPMFRQISRGRDHLFEQLRSNVFREVCGKFFRIVKSEKLVDSNREIYLLQK